MIKKDVEDDENKIASARDEPSPLLLASNELLVNVKESALIPPEEDTPKQGNLTQVVPVIENRLEDNAEEGRLSVAMTERRFNGSTIVKTWNSFVKAKCKGILLASFLILPPLGLYSFPKFLKSTDSTFHPVPGSLSEQAVNVFRNAYGTGGSGLKEDDPLNPGSIVVLDQILNNSQDDKYGLEETLVDGVSALSNATRTFSLGFEEYLSALLPGNCGRNEQLKLNIPARNDSNYDTDSDDIVALVKVVSYYSLKKNHLPSMAKALVTKDGHTTILYITHSIPSSVDTSYNARRDYVSSILDSIQTYGDKNVPTGVNIGYTGLQYFQKDLQVSVHADLHVMDCFVLPISLAILCIVLGCNFPIMIIPVVTITLTVCAWSSLMWPLTRYVMQVTQLTPTIMMSLTFGIGIDYTLFLLSRVMEEVNMQTFKDGQFSNKDDAITKMLLYSGHTIIISGVTLICTFLGLLLLPLHGLRSVGVGASMCIASSIVVNLTIVPAILHCPLGTYILCKRNIQWTYFKLKSDIIWQRCKRQVSRKWQINWKNNSQQSETVESILEKTEGYTCLQDLIDVNRNDDILIDNCTIENTPNSDLLEYRWISDGTNVDIGDINPNNCALDGRSNTVPTTSGWYRLSRYLLNPTQSFPILCVILLLLTPVALNSTGIKSTISFESMFPSSSPAMKTFNRLGEQFGEGSLTPYRLIFDGKLMNKKVDTKEGFDVMQSVIYALTKHEAYNDNSEIDDNSEDVNVSLLSKPHCDANFNANKYMSHDFETNKNEQGRLLEALKLLSSDARLLSGKECMLLDCLGDCFVVNSTNTANLEHNVNFTGIAWFNGSPIPYGLHVLASACNKLFEYCPIEVLHVLAELESRSSTSNGLTTYITGTLSVSAFSENGVSWLKKTRSQLKSLEDNGVFGNYSVVLEGGASVEYDAVQIVYNSYPKVICWTLCTVFVVVGIFFQSVVTPIRSVITICITLSFVYGLLVLVYQKNILSWTSVPSFQGSGEVAWIVPIMAFSIIVGLGLDYDIFLINRVLEYRLSGYTHQSSIVAGLHETGSIITAAGMIMAVAFGGLMLSTSPVLFQWSFLLTSSVLVDTFIIRTIVVPILLEYTGNYSWWPRKLPPERINSLDT